MTILETSGDDYSSYK